MNHDNDNNTQLRFLSVCSGIEAASVAWPQWQAVAFSEIEKFPSAVLAHHYPTTPNLGDFTKIEVSTLGQVDILCGGTPCQAFSIAGLRQSLQDSRGNLSLEFVRLAHELSDNNGLRNVLWENVPGVLSTKDNAYGCFLGGLVGAGEPILPPKTGKWPHSGMVTGPKGRAAWTILDAQHFGLAQRRKRVIVVADFGSGADPAAVLFERKSLSGYTPSSREKGKDIAPTISARPTGGGGLRTDFDLDGGVIAYAPEIARCDATREGSSQDYETTTMVAVEVTATLTATYGEQSEQDMMADNKHVVGVTGTTSHALTSEGADASEDGTGRATPIVCVHGTQDPCTSENTAFSLGRNSGGENVVCFTAKDYGGVASVDISPTLRAGGHSSSHHNGGVMPAVAWSIMPQNSGKDYKARQVDVAQPIMAGGPVGGNQGGDFIQQHSAVRRLTPTECERLQGFPDNYTNIPWRGKDTSPDGPRYKALGNSWAVPKFRWIGERLQRFMPAVSNDNTTNLAA